MNDAQYLYDECYSPMQMEGSYLGRWQFKAIVAQTVLLHHSFLLPSQQQTANCIS